MYGYKGTHSFVKHYFPTVNLDLGTYAIIFTKLNDAKLYFSTTGVAHCDDIILLHKPFENITLSADDEIIKNFLLDSLDSYAKTG